MASSSYALILFSLLIFSFSALKVSLSLYYQTLCFGCSQFIVLELPKIFKNGFIDIVDLNLVPYGNANILKNGTIICQHGPDECFFNTVEACAINVMSVCDQCHLELLYAYLTVALNPPHEYVPWVTVNEVPIRMDIENFMKYICKAYKGTSTPKACKELPKGVIPAEPTPNLKVCRVNDTSRMTKPRPRGITGWKF
ncbi:hypothetical protein MKW98_010409 [Papaver atlanticum]|uniref:Uncharacterized protein n=1 Tax=Papaver atlanticum TaxID=357466 RepID=A0AAD4XHR3_9MAGN|nr:hypothetical protein MKW98_010409 [Papaver atlanticum]